jgi:hypothetical protein
MNFRRRILDPLDRVVEEPYRGLSKGTRGWPLPAVGRGEDLGREGGGSKPYGWPDCRSGRRVRAASGMLCAARLVRDFLTARPPRGSCKKAKWARPLQTCKAV